MKSAEEQAQSFAEQAVLALGRLRRAKKKPGSIAALARDLGYRRETVSRAINQNEFPEVRRRIAHRLQISVSP
jgi:lambda repressor-like predicted transcriptional regulator